MLQPQLQHDATGSSSHSSKSSSSIASRLISTLDAHSGASLCIEHSPGFFFRADNAHQFRATFGDFPRNRLSLLLVSAHRFSFGWSVGMGGGLNELVSKWQRLNTWRNRFMLNSATRLLVSDFIPVQ
jgi:hypothetical protein